MMHKRRLWTVAYVSTIRDLAEKLTERSWCLCTGFQIGGYAFLNDATSEDGAQEYAVIRTDKLLFTKTDRPRNQNERVYTVDQVESVTASWMDRGEMEEFVTELLQGSADFRDPVGWTGTKIMIDHGRGHRCFLCA